MHIYVTKNSVGFAPLQFRYPCRNILFPTPFTVFPPKTFDLCSSSVLELHPGCTLQPRTITISVRIAQWQIDQKDAITSRRSRNLENLMVAGRGCSCADCLYKRSPEAAGAALIRCAIDDRSIRMQPQSRLREDVATMGYWCQGRDRGWFIFVPSICVVVEFLNPVTRSTSKGRSETQ